MYCADKLFLLVVVVVSCIVGQALCQYPSCGGTTGTLNNVVIQGCTPDQTCILQKGSSHSIEIDFTPSSGTSTLEADVYAIIGGVPIPYPGFDKNACNPNYNINCPLSANTQYQYKNQLQVPSASPSLTFQVKWQLVDDQSNKVICFLVNAKIEN